MVERSRVMKSEVEPCKNVVESKRAKYRAIVKCSTGN